MLIQLYLIYKLIMLIYYILLNLLHFSKLQRRRSFLNVLTLKDKLDLNFSFLKVQKGFRRCNCVGSNLYPNIISLTQNK